ncbi:MAG: RNA methyltransferase [Bacteroidia bacterium]
MQHLPQDFILRINNQLSEKDALSFLQALQQPAPVSIRLNPARETTIPSGSTPVPWCTSGYYLSERPVFTLDPLFHAGTYYVQEAGSMLIEALLKPHPAALNAVKVLDACAAPGGKSTHLLSMLDDQSVLVSNEIIPNRNKTLRYNLAKWGYSNKIITQTETKKLAETNARFHLILIDAPCSGEGLFRKDPAAVNEWSAERTVQCAIRQSAIIDDLIPLLHTGGYLLYSTCTYNDQENDQQIERLIHSGQFTNVTASPPPGIMATRYGWQAFPHNADTEGFYCCLLRYDGPEQPAGIVKSGITPSSKNGQHYLPEWLQSASGMQTFINGNHLNFASNATVALVNALNGAYIREFGIAAGEIKGNDLIPSHALALSKDINPNLPAIDLSLTDAIGYLKCGNIQADSEKNGWHLICYEKHPLGWAKKIAQRWNNYHPKEYRILMNTDNRDL